MFANNENFFPARCAEMLNFEANLTKIIVLLDIFIHLSVVRSVDLCVCRLVGSSWPCFP